ncbi:hypothetical protein CMT42_14965 [Elizabethkingia anophelis]|uniref:hypothetical protein n=1 Tax=Elizabethkingia anophelis TaxID=1117645 RepID=UPI00099A9840|nr:hypothetical protein [Elizabethkingia anophelis]MDV2459809.1 hypothetical protein [Elizabethkingia anophelis]MDV3894554.1 hypothetical protein [Elizabethkingia anophelis]MDV3914563.1 hypothetical protein [Elizabethkingia anophelis]MDV3920689.1 hypothetical protein [Elizabethkingia anophelis]MDV3959224.1 hypothetical protein [Elizabethkingia anophelis]
MVEFPLKIEIRVPEDPKVRTNMIINYIVYRSLNIISVKRILMLADVCKPDLSVIISRIHSFRLDVDLFNLCAIIKMMERYRFLTHDEMLLLNAEANKALIETCDYMGIKNTSPLYKIIDTVRTKN